LQIAERFYQTPLPPIIARGVTKQLGSFAPWELPQFIATLNPSETFSPSFLFPVQPVIGRTCSKVYFSLGRGRFLQLLNMSLLPCCPYHPAGMSCRIGQPTPCHVAFVRREKTRLPDLIFFRGHFWVHFRCSPVTRSPSLTMALSVGFTSFVSSTDATQAKGLLTFTPIGLPPIEHVCLSWTHSLPKITSECRINDLRRRRVTLL